MKLFVNAKPNSKTAKIEKIDETHFNISVVEPPVQGKANRAIAKTLAKHFGIAASRVTLVSGFSSKQKFFELI